MLALGQIITDHNKQIKIQFSSLQNKPAPHLTKFKKKSALEVPYRTGIDKSDNFIQLIILVIIAHYITLSCNSKVDQSSLRL